MKKLWCAAGVAFGIVGLSTNAAAVDWTVGVGAGVAPECSTGLRGFGRL
jgi:hypothetical protein